MSSPWASGQLKMPPQTTTDSLALSFSSFALLQERLSGYVLYTDALPHVAHLTANRYFFSLPSFPQTSSLPSLCTHTHTHSVTLLSLCSFESRASSLLFSPPPIDRVDFHCATPPPYSSPRHCASLSLFISATTATVSVLLLLFALFLSHFKLC